VRQGYAQLARRCLTADVATRSHLFRGAPAALQADDCPVCWICLDGPGPDRPLVHPCRCPSWCHAGCIARWQLQSAGTRCGRGPAWHAAATRAGCAMTKPSAAVASLHALQDPCPDRPRHVFMSHTTCTRPGRQPHMGLGQNDAPKHLPCTSARPCRRQPQATSAYPLSPSPSP
jgi:hypothetical protein